MAVQTLESRKLNLIVRISKLDKEESVRQIEDIEHLPSRKQTETLKKLTKPLRKKLDLGELKREQNRKPVNRKEFDRLIKEIDIQEPLEQLIANIGK